MNKSEIESWNGELSLKSYNLNVDQNPRIIQKKPDYNIEYTQEVAIRYLRPSTPPAPGHIFITKQPDSVTSPAPPIIIRQQPPRPSTPKPYIVREHPPIPPKPLRPVHITIPGKRVPPPPRKIVIERLPSMPAKPPKVIIERWLPYKAQKRRVIYKKLPVSETAVVTNPRNVIIQWETPKLIVKQEVKYLGEVRADPNDYIRRFGPTLKDSREISRVIRDIVAPKEVEGRLARYLSQSSRVCELEGDLEALGLVDLDKEGLSEYRDQLVRLGIVKEVPDAVVVSKPPVAVKAANGRKVNPEIINAIFNHIDRDSNGYLSQEEACSIFLRINDRLGRSYGEDDVNHFFYDLDRNGDGTINVEEFRVAFNNLIE